jgi:DNA-binding MarR family transcriptional regulator
MKAKASLQTELASLCFEMGRLLKKQMLFQDGSTSLLKAETMRFIEERGVPSMSELARFLRVSKPTATVLIENLAKEGFVKRLPDSADRRRILISLSQKGRRFLNSLAHKRTRAFENLFSGLSARDQKELVRILSIIIHVPAQ